MMIIFWVMTLILWVLIVATSSYAIHGFKKFNAFEDTGTAKLMNMYDMGRDW